MGIAPMHFKALKCKPAGRFFTAGMLEKATTA
jgi:hypothetical protein